MVERLIARANKAGENIPPWFPYMIRHATATADAMDFHPETGNGKTGTHQVQNDGELCTGERHLGKHACVDAG